MGVVVNRNPNCLHYYQGTCSVKPKFLKMLARGCNWPVEECTKRESSPPPRRPTPPPPPPLGSGVPSRRMTVNDLTDEEQEVIRTLRKSW